MYIFNEYNSEASNGVNAGSFCYIQTIFISLCESFLLLDQTCFLWHMLQRDGISLPWRPISGLMDRRTLAKVNLNVFLCPFHPQTSFILRRSQPILLQGDPFCSDLYAVRPLAASFDQLMSGSRKDF